MSKILKFLRPHIREAMIILVILVLKAYCDLALPGYTSDIVNVGIQQNGVDTPIPEQISAQDMDELCSFVETKDRQTVKAAYERDNETYGKEAYVLKKDILKDKEKTEELREILMKPMILLSGLKAKNPKTADFKLSDIPQEGKKALLEKANEKIQGIPEVMARQMSTLYIQTVYRSLGVDMGRLQSRYILLTGSKMLALAFCVMTASFLVGMMSARVAAATARDLRGKVFKKVVGFSNAEFDRFSTASLITRSTNDIQQIQMVTVMLLRMVLYAPIIGIGGIFKVLHTNVSMSWIIALGVLLISIVVTVLFIIVMPRFKLLQKLMDRLNLVAREILTGLQVIHAFSTERHEEKRFDAVNTKLTRTNLFVNRVMTFLRPTMMLIMNGISVLIIWVGANGINNGQMQVGDMMAFIQYTMQIIMSFLMICIISIMLPRAAVSAVRVDEVLNSRTMIHDPEQPEHFPKEKRGEVEFDNVSFHYPGAEEDVLRDLSFVAKEGKTTAFIGSTGSGKSTLINLIPRFYDVTKGAVLIAGKDIREVSQKELREKIGYVPQKSLLFKGTIASNIMFGNKDGSEEEMKEAAQIAQADEFIKEKEKGYESPISQGGLNVSGGQKQRLSIARAVARHPDIFIFDDSFSALDYKTDAALRRALRKKTKNSAVLIVAQRISTILHADQIIVLDEGKIVGKGTHRELLKSCEVYKQIAMSQLSEEEITEEMKS